MQLTVHKIIENHITLEFSIIICCVFASTCGLVIMVNFWCKSGKNSDNQQSLISRCTLSHTPAQDLTGELTALLRPIPCWWEDVCYSALPKKLTPALDHLGLKLGYFGPHILPDVHLVLDPTQTRRGLVGD